MCVWWGGAWSLFCCVVLKCAIILLRKRELVALLCVLAVVWVVCVLSHPCSVVDWSVIVAFLGHTCFVKII